MAEVVGGMVESAVGRGLSFRVLGPLEVVGPAGPVPLGGQKQRALLGLLLVRAGEVVSTDRLVEELWGEAAPPTAPTSLRNFVVQLRKLLGLEAILTRPPGYVLERPDDFDLAQFERLVEESRRAEPAERAALLREALALWRGPPLADLAFEPFAQGEIRRLEELRVEALEERIEAELALGDGAEPVAELEALVAAYPLRERLRALLMLALYRAGRQAEAVEAFHEARRTLSEELGIDPSPPLQQLFASILRQEPDLAPRLPLRPLTDEATVGLPTGTVTFLFTDIEGSTRLAGQLGERYGAVLAEHDTLLREAIAGAGGRVLDTQGDALFVAFKRAKDAVAAALAGQRALAGHRWPEDVRVLVRMGLHTGEPFLTGERYVGLGVTRAARICAAGHGGQILLSHATQAVVVDEELPEVEFRDVGEHRLKDLDRPERIFQLVVPDLPATFPPLDTLGPVDGKPALPLQPTPFLGRRHELDTLLALVRKPDVRLVTATGTGGSGKTRLALQAATELAEDYPDGVWWVPLASLREPTLVLDTIRQTLAAAQGEELTDAIGERRLLLVLDNFEHVLEAAPDVAELLIECPNLELLVTSREPLRVVREREYVVPPLVEPEAVALFAERAETVEPEEAVVEICRRLDCLPLAIELAAARTKLLAPETLLRRLEERLPLLTGGPRDAPERQRTLRATIAWSYELLSEEEKHLFVRLAVFAGGCTLEAAEEVCDADLDTLQALVEKNLVRRGGDRYQMLETIGEYAAERLDEAPDREAVKRRHAEYFLGIIRSVQAGRRFRWSVPLRRRLAADHDNLRAAIRWAIDVRDAELALRLATVFGELLWHVNVSEGKRWLDDALAVGEAGDATLRAQAFRISGDLAAELGDRETAARLLERSIAEFRALGELGEVARTLVALALSKHAPETFAEARGLYDEAVAISEQISDDEAISNALHNRGELELEAGNLAEARRLLERALSLTRQDGYAGLILHGLGDVELDANDIGRATSFYRSSLTRWTGFQPGAARFIGWCLAGLSAVAVLRGDGERAGRLWGAVERIEETTGAAFRSRERARYERLLAAGTKPIARDDVLAGKAMSLDDAVAYALEARD